MSQPKLLLLVLMLGFSAACAKSWRVSGAIVHIRQGEYEEAIKLLNEEVAASPDNAEAYALVGDAYASTGDFVNAEEAWASAEDIYLRKRDAKGLKKVGISRARFSIDKPERKVLFKVCPKCRKDWPADRNFCEDCGVKLEPVYESEDE